MIDYYTLFYNIYKRRMANALMVWIVESVEGVVALKHYY